MLPRNEIWQSLRTSALTAIPDGALLRANAPSTLAGWLTEGAYTVDRVSRDRFVVHGSAQEVGGALLGDASLYLDASIEHAYTLRYAMRNETWTSEGWSIVALYYWCFYLVTAWERLLGRTSVFLDEQRARAIGVLSGGPPAPAGTYRLTVTPAQDVGRAEVEIRKAAASRVHDATWRAWSADLRARVQVSRSSEGSRDELDYYESLLKPFNTLGETWPSDLRNAANYAPTFGYRAVRRAAGSFDLAQLRSASSIQFDDCFGRFRQNADALTRADIRAQSRLVSRVLSDMTWLLHAAFLEMYGDVLSRRQIDRRWSDLRARFARERDAHFAVTRWPLEGV